MLPGDETAECFCWLRQPVLIAQRFCVKALEERRLSIQPGKISGRSLRHLQVSDAESVPSLSVLRIQLGYSSIRDRGVLELLQAKKGTSQIHVDLRVIWAG